MKISITPDQDGMRLDAALKMALPELSRNRISKAIGAGHCKCNGQVLTDPAQKARTGMEICFEPPDSESALAAMPGELDVIFEDTDIAVCIKPAGLTVHPCPSCAEETLASRLMARFPGLASQGGERPGIVHRLDKDTSGLMVVALTERARLKLSADFAGREVRKKYLALVSGIAPQAGSSRKPIGRDPRIKTRMAIVAEACGGKPATTDWRRLWHNESISLLEVAIHTGRTHQIRVHLADQGHPIIGDSVYGNKQTAQLAPRQMLHAWKLVFPHPVTGEELSFTAPPPDDFYAAAAANIHPDNRIVVTGNQGCGKSSFCADLHKLGYPTTSADQIVADLYAGRSDATEWISSKLGSEALNDNGSVNKPGLLAILKSRPEMRPELEKVVHGLVLARIEQFWREQAAAPAAIAEIPLYFESAYARLLQPAPFVAGVSCPQELRWQRIAANRGWSQDKIATIESWQWPEARKMAACDRVIANTGGPKALTKAAAEFIKEFEASQRIKIKDEIDIIKRFCHPA